MQIDVNQTLQLRRSGSAVLVGILILMFLFGMSLMVALTDDKAMKRYFGWGGVLLFGAGLVSAAWRSRDPTKSLVTLRPQGMLARVSPKFVPWSAVEDWSVRRGIAGPQKSWWSSFQGRTWTNSRERTPTPGQAANLLVGVHELRIVPAELGMKADLLQTISVYAHAHRRKTA